MHALDSAWETLKRDFDAAHAEAGVRARRQASSELNPIFRRLRQYENEGQWIAALRDGIALGASAFAIFTLRDGSLRLRSRHNVELADELTLETPMGRAFDAMLDSKDTLVTLRTAGEVGAALSAEPPARAHLLPVENAGRIVAAVFVEDDGTVEMDTLELVTAMASAVLERRANQAIHSQIASAQITSTESSTAPTSLTQGAPAGAVVKTQEGAERKLPGWSSLAEKDRGLHAKAQRFSRVTVAEMQLARPAACRAGREQNNVYLFLQSDIDKARETYSRQYMTIPSMVDYLHLELVRAAADGDEDKLGAEYPGHLG